MTDHANPSQVGGSQQPAAMTIESDDTKLDLDEILAARWADPHVFPAAEFARAEAFWRARRARDKELLAVRAKAVDLIRGWTGCQSRDVGSFGLRLNLETNDLDVGIGYPVDQRDTLITVLGPHTVFKGKRKTRSSTTRLVLAFTIEGIEVDLSALAEEDFAVVCRMLNEIEATMTEADRAYLDQTSAT